MGFDGRSGRYTEVVGAAHREGGQARVHRCTDRQGRAVAVKWLSYAAGGDPTTALSRFAREGRRLSELTGRADTGSWVVPLLDEGERDGRPFLVLPWIEEDADTWRGGRSLVERLAVAAELCACVRRLHESRFEDAPAGLVHRDLKPKNALVDALGACARFGHPLDGGKRAPVVLSDLGGVRRAGMLTRTHSGLATLEYAGPEALFPLKPSRRSDWYALGITVFELLVGHRPEVSHAIALRFLTDDGASLLSATSSGDLARRDALRQRPLGELIELGRLPGLTKVDRAALTSALSEELGGSAGSRVSERLSGRLERALHADPLERSADAASLLSVLDDALADARSQASRSAVPVDFVGGTVPTFQSAPPPAPVQAPAPPGRSGAAGPVVAVAAAGGMALLAALVVVLLVGLWWVRQPGPALEVAAPVAVSSVEEALAEDTEPEASVAGAKPPPAKAEAEPPTPAKVEPQKAEPPPPPPVAKPSSYSVSGYRMVWLGRYWMGATEVTQGLWTEVMGSNPSYFSGCGSACPVETVSWEDAVAFSNALSKREGLQPAYRQQGGAWVWDRDASGYRLPTEAEWETAALAGEKTKYAGSDDLDAVGWYADNSGGKTHAARGKASNAWGLYDMSGNVWEWCWDAEGGYRVHRGGCWDDSASGLRVSYRRREPGSRRSSLGFRLARTGP